MRFPIILFVCGLPGILGAQTPTIAANGIVNGATLSTASPVTIAPGGMVSIFGSNLAAAVSVADTLPWPTELGGVSVTFGGMPGSLRFVAPNRVDVQAPWSLLERDQMSRMVPVVLTRGGTALAPVNVSVARISPGIFTLATTGSGAAMVTNADGTMAQPGGRAARIGSVITILATGLGGVSPTIPVGQASTEMFRRNTTVPEVLIGGRTARVLYSGLAADLPGINQVTAIVPTGVTPGNAVSIQLRTGGVTTPANVTIAVDGASEPATALPGPNATEIWSYLDRMNYRQNFPLLPGKGQLYQGIAPHAQRLTVSLSPQALEAVNTKAGSFPAGSFIIKDAHGPTRNLMNSLLMYKIPGFDPANNDWYYSTRSAAGMVGNSGSIAGCFGCHVRAKAADYSFLVSVIPPPQPNGDSVSKHIEDQNYRQTWRLMPGTTEMQPGNQPHGSMVSIWVNESAYDAMVSGAGKMPAGAIVLKENYNAARMLTARSIMYKSPGFDPANGDWFWLQQRPDGTAAAEGRVQACSSCHTAAASNDYLYAGSLAGPPAPNAAAVWETVTAQDYKNKWRLWPGTTAQMPGNAPHGALISTYVNDAAYEAIIGKRGSLPPGAIVLKENYMPDRTLAAVTLMYKSEGFDPDRNDWFWLQRLTDGTVRAEGRVAGCISCHTQNASNDYLFLSPLQ